VDAKTGVITTLGGDGSSGFSGEMASSDLAALNGPLALAVSANGVVVFADTYNHIVRGIDTNPPPPPSPPAPPPKPPPPAPPWVAMAWPAVLGSGSCLPVLRCSL
jgi:hypothetical protein